MTEHAPRVERIQGRRAGRGVKTFYRAACRCGWRGPWVAKNTTVDRHAAAHLNEGSGSA